MAPSNWCRSAAPRLRPTSMSTQPVPMRCSEAASMTNGRWSEWLPNVSRPARSVEFTRGSFVAHAARRLGRVAMEPSAPAGRHGMVYSSEHLTDADAARILSESGIRSCSRSGAHSARPMVAAVASKLRCDRDAAVAVEPQWTNLTHGAIDR